MAKVKEIRQKEKDVVLNIDFIANGVQGTLFNLLEKKKITSNILGEKIEETRFYTSQTQEDQFQLQNRRYIGGKQKLTNWILSIIKKECKGESFADIFAGTGIVSAAATKHFKKVILNDFLHSNYIIYQAFFSTGDWNPAKVFNVIKNFNAINGEDLPENYFSENFGGKYFSSNSAKIIGFIREDIESNKKNFTQREYYILLASLLYSIDKIANTVGHYDAYFKKESLKDKLVLRPIETIRAGEVSIFQEDANLLAQKIRADVVYIDPPYNSRQYSRFYHILETLALADKPPLSGVALKRPEENMSDYCRNKAPQVFANLIENLRARFIVVSYNNTYASKSSSSRNKIELADIRRILNARGQTKIFQKNHQFFNAGKTNFNNHQELLFVTKVT